MSNEQIIFEHLANIDTTAENIMSVNAVAGMGVQVTALARMLPDVAASVGLRAELLAVSRNLNKISNVYESIPLLEALVPLLETATALVAAKGDIAVLSANLHALTRLADSLDTLLLSPEYAAQARAAAESVQDVLVQATAHARDARTAQLNAEAAETSAHTAAATADGHKAAAATSAEKAIRAAEAAAAVSGMPDATTATPGDPLIWTGDSFGMGTFDTTLTSRTGVLGLSDSTLADMAEVRTTAEKVGAKAEQAITDAGAAKIVATEAKTVAEGVDAKAMQAITDASTAKADAATATTTVNGFGNRLEAAEDETLRVTLSLGAHTNDGTLHTPFETVVARIVEVVNGAMAELRDGGTGELSDDMDTLYKLSMLLEDMQIEVRQFLEGVGPDQRLGMVSAIAAAQRDIASVLGDVLTRMDVVNSLTVDEPTLPLSAAQGFVLRDMAETAQATAAAAGVSWIMTVPTVPDGWPEGFRSDGLLLVRPAPEGVAGSNITNAEWYILDRNKPARLALTAMQVRMTDGTTVQSAVSGALIASQQAQTAATEAKTFAEGVDIKATQAQSEAAIAKTDAAEAKSLAGGVDAKAEQAKNDAADGKAIATEAKTFAEGVDIKATQAQSEAAIAKTDAAEAKTLAEGVSDIASQAQSAAAEAKIIAQDVDAKATAAQTDAAAALSEVGAAKVESATALAKAQEALQKSPDIATQNKAGIVKGSDTVIIGSGGSLHVSGGGGGGGSLVVSPPIITMPSRVATGYAFVIGLAAGPVLLPGAEVANFEVTVDGGDPVNVPAVSGTATISHTPSGETGTIITVSVIAVDSLGNRSCVSDAQICILDLLIHKPVILSPEEGSHNFKHGILVTTELFLSTPIDVHSSSTYEVETVDGSTVYSVDVAGAHSAHIITNVDLIPGTQYKIFVTHKGASGAESERSQPVKISIRTPIMIGGGTSDSSNSGGFLYTSPLYGNAWANTVFETPIEPGMGGPSIYTIFGKGKILLATASSGTGGVSISEDGIHFTAPKRISTMQASTDYITVLSWKGIGYGNGLFTACGMGGQTSVSEDGVTWSTPIVVPGQSAHWRCMAYGKGRHVVGGQGGKVASSPDMINWTAASIIPGMTNTICGLRFLNDMFIACSEDGKISTSTDGMTWNSAVKLHTGVLWDCASDGVTIVLAREDGKVLLSTDAINWSQPYDVGVRYIQISMGFANGKFYFPCHTNGIFTSADGKVWESVAPVANLRYYYTSLVVE